MNIFITGATGAIGSELVAKLFAENKSYSICILVRNEQKARGQFSAYPQLKFLKGNVTDKEIVAQGCKNVDVVYHLAAVIPTQSKGEVDQSFKINTQGTYNVVDAMLAYAPKAFLFFSSSVAIYGDRILTPNISVTDKLEFHEDDFYSVAKVKSENYIKDSGINYSIFRLTAIMGLGNHKLNPLMFHVPLATKMEIATVNDTANAFSLALNHTEQLKGKTFNLGGGAEFRLTYDQFMTRAFKAFGLGKVNFPDNTFAKKGFHCGYMIDSDDLNDILNFRQDTLEGYFEAFQKTVPFYQRLVTRPFAGIIKFFLAKLSAPLKAYKKKDLEACNRFF